MFEAQVAYYLNLYLGQYVYGLDGESLKISVWKGDVELRNLTLRPEALQSLDLPITVKAGLLGKLTIKVPWARLGREPVVVEFDRLYILAGPKTETDEPAAKDVGEYLSQADEAWQDNKAQRVMAAEQAWIRGVQEKLQAAATKAAAAAAGKPSTSGGAAPGGEVSDPNANASTTRRRFPSIQSMIDPILANLQLVVTNVHVRYEDDLAWPGHVLSVGVLLTRLAAITVNEAGEAAWITSSLGQLLRKAIGLSNLAVYLDVDRHAFCLPRGVTKWSDMSHEQWDGLFLPSQHIATAPGNTRSASTPSDLTGSQRSTPHGLAGLLSPLGSMVYQHDFLICPVSGALRYSRRGAKALAAEISAADDDKKKLIARQEWRLSLEVVAVQLSSSQYSGAQYLAEQLNSMAQSGPYRCMRPRCRPHAGSAARCWWNYAINAVQHTIRRDQLSWQRLRLVNKARAQYVPAYAAWLSQGGMPGACPGVAELEKELEEPTILQFRKMAHAKAGTTTKVQSIGDATAAGGGRPGALPGQGGNAGQQRRTWFQYLGIARSGAPQPPQQQQLQQFIVPAPAAATSAEGSQSESGNAARSASDLTSTEWAKLEEMLISQSEELALDESEINNKESPFSLRTLCTLDCKSLQLQLTTKILPKPVPKSLSPSPSIVSVVSQQQQVPQAGPLPDSTSQPVTTTIAVASASQLQLRALFYPATKDLAVQVASADIIAPQGEIFHVGGNVARSPGSASQLAPLGSSRKISGLGVQGKSGLGLKDLGSVSGSPASGTFTPSASSYDGHGNRAGPASTTRPVVRGGLSQHMQRQRNSSGNADLSSPAMVVTLCQSPQDGHADLVVGVTIAPSYVTWQPEAVQQITQFFTPDKELELEALQAQAAVQGEALWKLTSLRLQDLSQAASRPRLDLRLSAHAPKLALPHPDGNTVLLLDLGRVNLKADRSLAAALPEVEAALYECMDANLESLAAYLVKCPSGDGFKWPHQQLPYIAYQQPQVYINVNDDVDTPASAAAEQLMPGKSATSARPARPAQHESSHENVLDALDSWGFNASPAARATRGATAPGTERSRLDPSKTTDQSSVARPGFTLPTAMFIAGMPDKQQRQGLSGVGGWDIQDLLAGQLNAGWQLVPLLDRFSMDAGLQIATAVHPRYPKARVNLTCSPLHLHLSPARYHQLFGCIAALSKPVTPQLSASPATPAGSVAAGTRSVRSDLPAGQDDSSAPAWRTDAEHQAVVWVRESPAAAAASTAKPMWLADRLACVWRGRLVIAASPISATAVSTTVYWRGAWRLLQVPAKSSRLGRDHVLVLATQDAVEAATASVIKQQQQQQQDEAANTFDALPTGGVKFTESAGGAETEEQQIRPDTRHAGAKATPTVITQTPAFYAALALQPGVVILATEDATQLSALHSALARSRNTMKAVAGLLLEGAEAADADVDDDASSQGRLRRKCADGSQGVAGDDNDGEEEDEDLLTWIMKGHSELVAIKGSIPEVVVHLSGRPPPTTTPDDLPPEARRATSQTSFDEADDLPVEEFKLVTPTLQEEVPIINIRLQTALLESAYNGQRLHAAAAMRALVIEDKVLGPRICSMDPDAAYLAYSGESSDLIRTTTEDTSDPQQRASQNGQRRSLGQTLRSTDDEDEDEFFDASGSWVSPGTSPQTCSTQLGESAGSLAGFLGSTSMSSSRNVEPPVAGILVPAVQTSAQSPEVVSNVPLQSQQSQQRRDDTVGLAGSIASSVAKDGNAKDVEDRHQGSGGGGGCKSEPLVWLSYTSWSENAVGHPGVCAELNGRLSSLTLRTQRPTVSCLMTFGFDMMAVNLLLAQDKQQLQEQQLASLSMQQQGTAATVTAPGNADSDSDTEDTASSTTGGVSTLTYGAAGSTTTGSTTKQSSNAAGLASSSPRVYMRIALEMKKLQLVLPYETGTAPLLSGSMDGFSLLVDTTSEGMDITTSLGNLVTECGVLPDASPYRKILQLRPGGPESGGSLISVKVTSRAGNRHALGGRAPLHGIGTVYHISAELQAVQLVYLQCVINQIMSYLYVLVTMGPKSRLPPPPPPSAEPPSQSGHSTAVVGPAPTAIILDLDISAPLVLMPHTKLSTSCIELDLGRIHLSNSLSWVPMDREGWKLLQDSMRIRLWGVGLVVVQPDGKRGHNCVHDLGNQGLVLRLTRSVALMAASSHQKDRKRPPLMPSMQTHIEVELLDFRVADNDYHTGLAILAGNYAEPLDMEPDLIALQQVIMARAQRWAEEAAATALIMYAPSSSDSLALPGQQRQLIGSQSRAAAAGGVGGVTELGVAGSKTGMSPFAAIRNTNVDMAISDSTVSGMQQDAAHTSGMQNPSSVARGGGGGPAIRPGALQDASSVASTGGARWNQLPAGSRAQLNNGHKFNKPLSSILQACGQTFGIGVTLSVKRASLQLHHRAPTHPSPQPLAKLLVTDMWLSYCSSSGNGMFVSLALPVLSIHDMRPGAHSSSNLVFSTTDTATIERAEPSGALSPSLMFLEYRYFRGDEAISAATARTHAGGATTPTNAFQSQQQNVAHGNNNGMVQLSPAAASAIVPTLQATKIRLQKPTLVLDLAFLMPLLAFVAPQTALTAATPKPWASRDIILKSDEEHHAQGDVWLSPEVRLLADTPGTADLVYNGHGHALVLPAGLHPSDTIHLIMVGQHRTLTLRNVKLVNSDSLSACLSLSAGAQLLARPEDGVVIFDSVAAAGLEEQPQHVGSRSTRTYGGTSHRHRTGDVGAAAQANSTSTAVNSTFEFQLEALGARLHVLDSGSAASSGNTHGVSSGNAGNPSNTPKPASQSLSRSVSSKHRHHRSLSIGAVSGLFLDTSSPVGSTHDVTKISQIVLRRLVLAFDLTVAGQMKPLGQKWQLGLQGLSMSCHSTTITSPHQAQQHSVSTLTSPTANLPPSVPPTGRDKDVSALQQQQPRVTPRKPSSAYTSGVGAGSAAQHGSCTVLQPCNVAVTYDTREGPGLQGMMSSDANAGPPVVGSTSLAINVSALEFALAPDVLQLMLSIQQSVRKPLVAPPASTPIFRCDTYERLFTFSTSSNSDATSSTASSSPSLSPVNPLADASVTGSVLQGHITVDQVGKGGVDPWSKLRSVSLWRPQAPDGYLSLGDVAVTGNSAAPQFSVAVVAVNSGLVAWPVGFEMEWDSGHGLVLWRPVPPDGYASMGLVTSFSIHEPPSLQSVACIHLDALVSATASQCALQSGSSNFWSVSNVANTIVAAPTDLHTPRSQDLYDLRMPLAVAPVALTPEADLKIRLPPPQAPIHQSSMRVSNTHMVPHDPANSPTSPAWNGSLQNLSAEDLARREAAKKAAITRALQQRFLASRRQLASATSADTLTTTTVEFKRIWWDREVGSSPAAKAVSYWRPIPPAGYVSLGDCMVAGRYAPPQNAVVVRDVLPSAASLGSVPTSQPIVIRPLGYARVWSDEHKAKQGFMRYLNVWRPVAPAGYTALGCVVSMNSQPPPTGILRCIRSDLVKAIPLHGLPANWRQPSHRQRPPLSCWTIDAATHTFIALTDDEIERRLRASGPSAFPPEIPGAGMGLGNVRAQKHEAYTLRLPLQPDDRPFPSSSAHGSSMAPARHFRMQVNAGHMSLLLQTTSKQPLLELGLKDIQYNVGNESEGVMRGCLYAMLGLCSYAASHSAWEPILDSFEFLAHLDINGQAHPVAGVQPGTWLKLTSTQSNVRATLSHRAAAALILAANEWSAAVRINNTSDPSSSASAAREGAIAALTLASESGQETIELENQLGSEVEVAVCGAGAASGQEYVTVPPGTSYAMQQAVALPPPSPLAAERDKSSQASVPVLCLVIDVLGLIDRRPSTDYAPVPDLPGQHQAHPLVGSPDTPTLLEIQQQLQEAAKKLTPAQQSHVHQLACNIEVQGPVAEFMSDGCWGCSTRAVACHIPLDGADQARGAAKSASSPAPSPVVVHQQMFGSLPSPGIADAPTPSGKPPKLKSIVGDYVISTNTRPDVAWNERFLLALPDWLVLQMVTGAGAADFHYELVSGVPATLRFSFVDHDRPTAQILAAASAPVDYDWLVNQTASLRHSLLKARPGLETLISTATSRIGSTLPSGATTPDPARSSLPGPTGIAGFQTRSSTGQQGGYATPSRPGGSAAPSGPEPLQLSLPIQALLPGNAGNANVACNAELLVALSLVCPQAELSGGNAPRGLGTARNGGSPEVATRQMVKSYSTQLNSLIPAVPLGPLNSNFLRLPPSGVWYPIPTAKNALAASDLPYSRSATGVSVVPLPGHQGAVLEISGGQVPGSTRHMELRSLCKVANACSIPIQVSLVLGNDEAAWTLIPKAAGQSAGGSIPGATQQQATEDEVFENECWVPLRGWSHTHLLAGDRLRYNRGRTGGGDSTTFPQLPLPQLPTGQKGCWEWEGSWEVETGGHTDPDGWAYGGNWLAVNYPFTPGCGMRRPTDVVRRRRWVRTRVFNSRPDAGAEGPKSATAERRRVLGVLQPGGSMSLPLGWDADGNDLQIRPLLYDPFRSGDNAADGNASAAAPKPLLLDAHGRPLHHWSVKAVGGLLSLDLSLLQDGSNHLMCCMIDTPQAVERLKAAAIANLGADDVDPAQIEEAQLLDTHASLVQPYWISLTVECDQLVTLQGSDVSEDWRLVARPPLMLVSHLPVTSRYCVWERVGGAGGRLKGRQHGSLEPWGACPLYSVDVRQQVCLTMSPEGCEFAEPEPLLLLEGIRARSLAGAAGSPRLPDSFRCAYVNSTAVAASLRLAVYRQLDSSLDAVLPRSSGAGSFSGGTGSEIRGTGSLAEAVARGSPMCVHVSASLAVVNNCQLPVNLGVLVLEGVAGSSYSNSGFAGRQDSSSGDLSAAPSVSGGNARMSVSGGQSIVRIVDTDAFTSSPRPSSHIIIQPRSLELLSLPAGVSPSVFMNDSGLQVAIAMACQGSKWCAPVHLPTMSMSQQQPATPGGVTTGTGNAMTASTAAAGLASGPVLIRARGKQDGLVHDLVVRFEAGSTRNSIQAIGVAKSKGGVVGMSTSQGSPEGLVGLRHVMHVTPHLVVSNRTGYNIQVVQPEAATDATSGPATPLASGAGAAGMHASGSNLLPQSAMEAFNKSETGATALSSRSVGGGLASLTGSDPAASVLAVPAGSAGIPVAWHQAAATRKLLSLRLQHTRGVTPLSDLIPMSQLPLDEEIQVLLPVAPISHSVPASGLLGRTHSRHLSVGSHPVPALSSTFSYDMADETVLQAAAAAAAAVPAGPSTLQATNSSNVPDSEAKDNEPTRTGSLPTSLSVQRRLSETGQPLPSISEAPSVVMRRPTWLVSGAVEAACQVLVSNTKVSNTGYHGSRLHYEAPATATTSQDGTAQSDNTSGNADGDPDADRMGSSQALPYWIKMVCSSDAAVSGHGATASSSSLQEYVGVVVTLKLTCVAPGSYALELLRLGDLPMHAVHNSTGCPVAVREHRSKCAWQVLPPWSCRGIIRQDLTRLSSQPGLEVELADPAHIGTGAFEVITFDTSSALSTAQDSSSTGTGSGGAAGSVSGSSQSQPQVGNTTLLRLGNGTQAEAAAAADASGHAIMTTPGAQSVAGPAIKAADGLGGGNAHAEQVVRISPVPKRQSLQALRSGDVIMMSDQALGVLPAGLKRGSLGTNYSIEISGLEVGLVDDRPQELLSATLEGLFIDYSLGMNGPFDFTQLSLKIRNMQVDDALPGTPHPVLLLPQDAHRHEGASGPNTDPVLQIDYLVEPGRRAAGLYVPCCAFSLAPLRVALWEATLWRLLSCLDHLNRIASRSADHHHHHHGGQQPGTVLSQQQIHAREQAEQPLILGFLHLEDIQLRVSFKPEPSSRRIANQLVALGVDLVSLDDLELDLPGLFREDTRRVHRAELMTELTNNIISKLMSMAFSILSNAGLLGSTSKILAVASQGMAQLTDTRGGHASGNAPAAPSREVGNLGEGMLEGGKALAKGVLAGAVGILAKPVEGAERGGVAGFFSGVGKGVAGVVVNPLSGMLSAAAKVTEGMDATVGRVRDTILSAPRRSGRKRLPRAIKGDGLICSYSLHDALGQALMQSSTLQPVAASVLSTGLNRQVLSRLTGATLTKAAGVNAPVMATRPLQQDCYEDHWVLPGAQVLLLTNKRIVLLDAPEFVQLQQSVDSGQITHVTDVPGGIIKWIVPWDALLAAELAWHQPRTAAHAAAPTAPDGLLLHRKERGPDDDKLLYDVRCHANTAQAQDIIPALLTCWYKYRPLPRGGPELSGQPLPLLATAAERAMGQTTPASLLSSDWQLVWHSQLGYGRPASAAFSRSRMPASVWRPKGPPGYSRLGDVLVHGLEPPPRPVHMYLDTMSVTGALPASVADHHDGPGEGPRLSLPQGFSLVFRDSGPPAMTVWRPIPRRGYVDVGCVVWPAMEEPPLGVVRCLRRDLAQPAHVTDSPVWAAVSSDNQFWKVAMWPVDNVAHTFVAVKGETKPRQAFSPVY